VSRSLSRNLARNAAVLGGLSVSIAAIVNPGCRVAKLGSQLFYQSPVFMTRLNRMFMQVLPTTVGAKRSL
jgi:hypothetical protein